jgi:Peptidase family M23
MSTPSIDVIVYPPGPSNVQRELYYLELAPADSLSQPVYPIPLQIWIKNKMPSAIHLEKVEADFPDIGLTKIIPVDLSVGAGASNQWYASNQEYIFLDFPISFTLNLSFTGFSDPWTDTVHLVRFTNSYSFPGKAADLQPNEFWMGSGATHAGGGDQIFHYDLGMLGWDPNKNQWSDTYPNTTGTHNADFRIWNRPVYALADGVVTFYQNDQDENPKPGEQLSTKGWGNAFNIQHGPYLATYMHMREGSLNPALTQGYPQGVEFPNGPAVKAGDFLGMAGNAGSSSAPHLHVGLVLRDVQKVQFSIPLAFQGVSAIDDTSLSFSHISTSPWVWLTNQGLPQVTEAGANGAVAFQQMVGRQLIIYQAAIDPLALLLGAQSATYIRLTLPDPPPLDVIPAQVRAQVSRMSASERQRALARLKRLREYVDVLARELGAPS